MNERIVLVDSSEKAGVLLAQLIEFEVVGVRVDHFLTLGDAMGYGASITGLILCSLRPTEAGSVSSVDRDLVKSVEFLGSGFLAVCSAFLADEVFRHTVARLEGPGEVHLIGKSDVRWTLNLIEELRLYISNIRLQKVWRSFFPGRSFGTHSRIDVSTEFEILKQQVRGLPSGFLNASISVEELRRRLVLKWEERLKRTGVSLA